MSSFHLRFVGEVEQAGTANECGVCGEVTNGRLLRCQKAGFTRDSNRYDLHRNRDHPTPQGEDKFSAVLELLRQGRVLRAEDQLSELLDEKRVTPAAVKKAITRTKWVTELLAHRIKGALAVPAK